MGVYASKRAAARRPVAVRARHACRPKRFRPLRVEQLEGRLLLTHGPTFLPDGSVEVTLDDTFDQFGFQPAIFQAFDPTPADGFDDALASFSVFDTGASVVTFGAQDQLLFDLVGFGGIPVGVACGAVAEAVGGLSLVGHVSQRGTVVADGLHVSRLIFDADGFPIFELGFHDPEIGTVQNPLPGNADFLGDAGLSAQNDAYNGFYLSFTTGPLRGAVRQIVDYTGATRRFVLSAPFSQEPAAGDNFLLIADEVPFVNEVATSTVSDSTPAADEFSGPAALSAQDNFYQGQYIQFTSGALAGQVQQITAYTGATRTFHFARPFSTAPGADNFKIVQVIATAAAIAPGVQAFIGTYEGTPPAGCPSPASPTLPTLAGTPMLSPSPDHPNGLAVNIRPFGALLDFSDFVGFEGLIVPVPDVEFQEPGLGIRDDPACLLPEGGTFRNICTDTIRVPLEFLGNLVDADGQLTEAYNPVHRHVTVSHTNPNTGELVELTDQVFLYDTGAQLSVISTAQALAFGLNLNNPEDTISVQTAGGVIADLPGYRIESITLPLADGTSLTFKNVWVFVVDAAAGLLDGIMGMNLFNLASAMLYDPWHVDGPVLELKWFTDHLFDLPFAEVIEVEPNDAPADATPVRPGEFGAGEIVGSDVVDYWASPGANEGDLIFAYVDTLSSTSSKDATLAVYDKNQNQLAADDNDGPGPSPVVAGVTVPSGQAGTVFYEVREASGGNISRYDLYTAVVDPLDVQDEGEVGSGVNDTAATATPITRTMVNGAFGAANDADHYELLATEGSRIVVMVDNDPDKNGDLTATRVSILDPNGAEIFPPTTGDADGNATAAGAVILAPLTGMYKVRITEAQGGTDNDYRFVASVLDGGAELFAGNLVLSAEARKAAAQQVLNDFEQALANCNGDIFCEIDVLLQYQGQLSQAIADLVQAESVLVFAGSISGSAMPTFVNVGQDLSISIADDAISENGGATTATVRRSDTSGELTVTLTSSDTSEATVVGSVVIPDGQRMSAPFTITAQDDTLLDGSQEVTISAAAAGYGTGLAIIQVTDHEQLTVSIAAGSISENGGSTAATVTRADPTGELTVNLSSDDTSEATVATTVVIPDGQLTSPSFAISAVDDMLLDGSQTVTLTATASGYEPGTATLEVTDHELLSIAIAENSISEDGGATTATVTRTDSAGALTVNLQSSDTSEATVVTTVVIPNGETTSAPFSISAVDDALLDGTRSVTITATASGYEPAAETLDVTDHEQLSLALVDSSISENGGSTAATVTRTDPAGPLTVNLSGNDPSEATVVATVVIPDGQQTSPPFDISAVDDALLDGTQTVTFTASAAGYESGSDTLSVTDHERLTLSIADDSISENGGATTATVARAGTVGNLTVNLQSDDTSEATVAATVVIPDGQTMSSFAVDAVDDALVDGSQTVTITASAAGYEGDTETVEVTDHESLTLSLQANSISENGGATTATVTRTDTAGDLTVDLLSDDTSEATVVATVVIPDGQAVSAPVALNAVDDALLDGQQAVTITASAAGYLPDQAPLQVTDHEQLTLSIADDAISEKGGATTATVTRTDPTGDLAVNLVSDDTSEAVVAIAVVIPDGQTMASFAVDAVDDTLVDGSQTVTITASAAGYLPADDTLTVTDDGENSTSVQIQGTDLMVASSGDGALDTDDQLTIKTVGNDLVITNPNHPIASSVLGASGAGTNELTVPLNAFSGNIVVETGGGSDTLTLDASLTALASAVIFRGGDGDDDRLHVEGAGVTLDLNQLVDVDRIDIRGSGGNTLQGNLASVSNNVRDAADALMILSDQDDQVQLGDSWSLSSTQVIEGVFFRTLRQADATVLLAGPLDWQNPLDPNDVNADGQVVSFDILFIINQLNTPTLIDATGRLVAAASLSPFPMLFYDVDGNGFGTSFDALRIINFFNSQPQAEGESLAELLPQLGPSFVARIATSDLQRFAPGASPKRAARPTGANAAVESVPVSAPLAARPPAAGETARRSDRAEPAAARTALEELDSAALLERAIDMFAADVDHALRLIPGAR